VVTARRFPERVFRSDRSLSVVDRVRLRTLAPRTVPEALWESAGVFVQQTNHGGGSPILRGLVGPQVLILVDGVRLNNSVYRTGPVQYLNLLDPYSLERLEVLRGPGSVLYGSDAMGGVIQAIPAAPRPAPRDGGLGYQGRLLGRYGSADRSAVLHGRFQLGYGGLAALGGVSFKALDDLRGGRGVGVQPFSGYTHYSATGQVVYRFGSDWLRGSAVKIGYLMGRIYDAGRTDKLESRRSLQIYDNEDDLLYAQLRLRLTRLRTRGRLSLSYQHFYEQKDNRTVAEDLRTPLQTTRDRTRVHTAGVDLSLETHLWPGWLRLQYGGMWYRDQVDAGRWHRSAGQPWARLAQQPYPDGSSYQNWGGFAVLQASLLPSRYRSRLLLDLGYRLHGMRGDAPAQPGLPAVGFSQLGHVVSSSLRYRYADTALLALSFSQGFRAPNLFEAVMLGDTGQFFHIPNAALGPERSDTLELIMRGRFGRVRVGYAVYVSWLEDLIKRDFTTWEGQPEVGGKPVTWNINAGRGLLFGMEGSLRIRLYRGLSLSGHVTYTWGEQRVEGGLDLPLRLIPPLYGVGVLRYALPRWGRVRAFAEASVRGAGRQRRLSPEDAKDSRIPTGGTPAWWTLNLRLGARIGSHVRVSLAAENLLDARYKYHGSGVFAPGTQVVLTLESML
jgi:outer membrane receptor protein involved in Fe transport